MTTGTRPTATLKRMITAAAADRDAMLREAGDYAGKQRSDRYCEADRLDGVLNALKAELIEAEG